MPKGISNTTRKKSNLSDFASYAKGHQNLSPKQIYDSYRENSQFGIKKQTALNIMRDIFGYEVNEQKGKTIQEKKHIEKNYVSPVKIPRTRKSRVAKVKIPRGGKRNYINLDLSKEVNRGGDVHYLDGQAVAVKTLKKNIKQLYGIDGDEFLQISLRINNDGYTKLNDFSIMLPYNNEEKYAVKKLGVQVLDNLFTYYSNLAKRYSNKASYKKLKNDMIDNIKEIRKSLSKSTNVDRSKLELLFAEKGIKINTFQVLKIIHTEGE